MQLQDFYHQRRVQNIQKGRRPRTTDDPEGGPEGPTFPEDRQMRRAAPTAPSFLDSPGGKQPEPLPAIKAGQEI